MSEHLKSAVIYGELTDYMIALFKKNPEFSEPAIEILDLVAEIHQLNLDYKNTSRLEKQEQLLKEVIDTLMVNFDKQIINRENIDFIFKSITDINEADKNYLLNYFDKKKEALEGILVAANNVSTALDRACGRIPEEPKEKFSLFKAIGNFFKLKTDNHIDLKDKEFAQKELNEMYKMKKNKF